MKRNRASLSCVGFSIPELLVVLGILAVLLILSFGIMKSAGEKSRNVQCLSNLRQIATGVAGYTSDKGYYPGVRINTIPRSWFHGLEPYITGNPVPTPSTPLSKWAKCPGRGAETVGYGYNQYFGNIPPGSGDYSPTSPFNKYWRLNPKRVEEPMRKIVLGDNHDKEADSRGFAISVLNNGSSADNVYRARRHSEGGNYLFADGHIEWISAVEMSKRLSVNNKEILKPFVD